MRPVYWLIIALILAGAGTVVYTQTRGLRNNNPGNIRRTSTVWQGQRTEQTDPEYVQFITPEYGIRALARTLNTYRTRYNLNTVRGIISRWAPPNENLTDAYVNHVAERLMIGPDYPINWATQLPELVKAIIQHENGLQPYSDQTILTGISMA